MTAIALVRLFAASLAPIGLGCVGEPDANTTSLVPTPASVLAPEAPAAAAAPVDAPARDADAEITLVPVKWEEYRARIADAPAGTRYTIVDAWATYCPPCKENFPHLVEMHERYGPKGLRVVSLSLDDPLETKDVEAARAFLREQKAAFTNLLMNEEPAEGYGHLEINAIPAVFVYGPYGKELRRFTLDDVDNQFTYEQVEQYLRELFSDAPK